MSTPFPEDEAIRLNAKGLKPDDHVVVPSRGIVVGDVVLFENGKYSPCDMVLLSSSGEGGVAFVSTANLDGESNLKRILVAEATSSLQNVVELRGTSALIRAQKPSPIYMSSKEKCQMESKISLRLTHRIYYCEEAF